MATKKGKPVVEPSTSTLESISTLESMLSWLFISRDMQDNMVTVISTLGQIGDERAVFPLTKALENKYPHEVKIAAARALGMFDSPKAIEALINVWLNSIGEIRIACVDSLKKIGKPIINQLMYFLRDDNIGEHESVAFLLGQVRWKPDISKYGAYYWIAKGNWDKCVLMGNVAIKPLMNMLDRASKQYSDIVENLKKQDSLYEYNVYMDDDSPGHSTYHSTMRGLDEMKYHMQKAKNIRSKAAQCLSDITGQNFGEDVNQWKIWVDKRVNTSDVSAKKRGTKSPLKRTKNVPSKKRTTEV